MNVQRNKPRKQPQLNQQLAAQEEQRQHQEQIAQKQETTKYLAKKISDFCFDVAKLIIGGIILTGLVSQDMDVWSLMFGGIVSVLLFLSFGVHLIRKMKLK